jgi:hypothetical protein
MKSLKQIIMAGEKQEISSETPTKSSLKQLGYSVIAIIIATASFVMAYADLLHDNKDFRRDLDLLTKVVDKKADVRDVEELKRQGIKNGEKLDELLNRKDRGGR